MHTERTGGGLIHDAITEQDRSRPPAFLQPVALLSNVFDDRSVPPQVIACKQFPGPLQREAASAAAIEAAAIEATLRKSRGRGGRGGGGGRKKYVQAVMGAKRNKKPQAVGG